jgi:Ca2+-transporting ATPase
MPQTNADPPRQGVHESIAMLQSSQSRVVMITGDAKDTAIAIASSLGFYECHQHSAMAGAEVEKIIGCKVPGTVDLDSSSSNELLQRIRSVNVFYRTSPRHKLAIVRLLQQAGEIVAMTGDGVNDAPALSAADIGRCCMVSFDAALT